MPQQGKDKPPVKLDWAENLNGGGAVQPLRPPDIADTDAIADALKKTMADLTPGPQLLERYAQRVRQPADAVRQQVGAALDQAANEPDPVSGMTKKAYLAKVLNLTERLRQGQAISRQDAEFLYKKFATRDFKGKETLPPVKLPVAGQLPVVIEFKGLEAGDQMRWQLSEYLNRAADKEQRQEKLRLGQQRARENLQAKQAKEREKLKDAPLEERKKLEAAQEKEQEKLQAAQVKEQNELPRVKIEGFSLPGTSTQLLRKLEAAEWKPVTRDRKDYTASFHLGGIENPDVLLSRMASEKGLKSFRMAVRDVSNKPPSGRFFRWVFQPEYRPEYDITATVSRDDYDRILSPVVNSSLVMLKEGSANVPGKPAMVAEVMDRQYRSRALTDEQVQLLQEKLRKLGLLEGDITVKSENVDGRMQKYVVIAPADYDRVLKKVNPELLPGLKALFSKIEGIYSIPLTEQQLGFVEAKLKNLGLEGNGKDYSIESDQGQKYLLITEQVYDREIKTLITRIEANQRAGAAGWEDISTAVLQAANKAAAAALAVFNNPAAISTILAKPQAGPAAIKK